MASKVDNPLVSIIVPMYNVGTFALPCVRSLLNQTYPNIEILIVDDGCTDDTIDLIENTVGDDPRVEIHHKKNGGALFRSQLRHATMPRQLSHVCRRRRPHRPANR